MRVWDIDPGYLNDKSLLGEHREVHGIFSIISKGKKGYSRHPETLRWVGSLGALALRHELLVEEMGLRGFRHKSPIAMKSIEDPWPEVFIDSPGRQYAILREKYLHKEPGRIPLPADACSLWAGHKYSVMARDPERYKKTGPALAAGEISLDDLAGQLVDLLRERPSPGRLKNALHHMWGYISRYSEERIEEMEDYEVLDEIRKKTGKHRLAYLLNSTALGELGLWCRP